MNFYEITGRATKEMHDAWDAAQLSDGDDIVAFFLGWEAAVASMRPHLDQLAAQLGVAPVGDLTGELEGVTIGAEQAQM